MRDEILNALRETEPDWLGSARGLDTDQELQPSQPVDFGDDLTSGEAESPEEQNEDYSADGFAATQATLSEIP